jgi:SAM-dependent methyltransferase
MPGATYDFVADAVSAVGARDVLELGCGAQQYRGTARARYVGIDLPTSPYLEVPPSAYADGARLPFRRGAFDLVFGVAVFNLFPDVVTALEDCRRVLRDGGTILVFDYQRDVCERLEAAGQVAQVWDGERLRSLLTSAGFRAVRDRSEIVDSTGHPDAVRRLVRRARRHLRGPRTWLIVEATA